MDEDLDLDLIQPPSLIAGLDVDDAELVVEELALVVGVEDLHRADRCREFGAEQGVEEVDQEGAVVLRPQQGLEDAVDLGVDRVAHGKSLAQPAGLPRHTRPSSQGDGEDRWRGCGSQHLKRFDELIERQRIREMCLLVVESQTLPTQTDLLTRYQAVSARWP